MLNILFCNRFFCKKIRKRTVSGRISKRAPRPYPLSSFPGPPFSLRSLFLTPFDACYAGYQLCAYVRQPKNFSMDTKFVDFIVHWSIAALKFFKENLSENFGLINRCFRESSPRSYKKSSALRLTDSHVFMVDRNRASLILRLVGCRIHRGHLQNK